MYLGFKTHMHSLYTNISINSFRHTRPDSPVCRPLTSTVLKTIIMSLKNGGAEVKKKKKNVSTAELVVINHPGVSSVNSI